MEKAIIFDEEEISFLKNMLNNTILTSQQTLQEINKSKVKAYTLKKTLGLDNVDMLKNMYEKMIHNSKVILDNLDNEEEIDDKCKKCKYFLEYKEPVNQELIN